MRRLRPKILVESYECSPLREHAPGAAWQIIRRLGRWYEVWVLVEETQYRDEIETCLAQHPQLNENLHFEFIPRRHVGGFKRQRPPLPIRETLDYRHWEIDAFTRARKLHAIHHFDAAHHLRTNTFRTPGLLWKLDCPFVWGPMGGTSGVSAGLTQKLPLGRQVEYTLKNTLNAVQLRLSPAVRRAVNKAAVIFAQTSADQQKLKQVFGKESILLHEQASGRCGGSLHRCGKDSVLNIAWIGRCIAGKAMETLLHAAARTDAPNRLRLHLVGDGPEQARWKALARSLELESQCTWYGWVDQARASAILNSCDLLAFTSILEGTSATVMKAMGTGVPIVCLKHFGMGDVVDSGCGFPIPIGTSEEVVNGFASAFNQILCDPGIIERLSAGSLDRAKLFTWNRLANTIRDAYSQRVLKPGVFDDATLTFPSCAEPAAVC